MSTTSYSKLTDEEKFVIDSNDEMNERKNIIISGIVNGKSKLLEITSTKHKTKPVTFRFVKEFDEIVGVDLEKFPESQKKLVSHKKNKLVNQGLIIY